MKQVWSFVLTGGPCSGKTTALSTIEQELSNRGYYVLIIPETASELIPNGIRPFRNSLNIFDFQQVIFKKQLFKEELYREIAYTKLSSDKIVILHDRGIIDNKSYISEDEFKKLLISFNMNEVEARNRYDAVFHLVTAADGAEEFYTLDNNTSRTETPEEAIQLDKKGISNWTGHPHLRVIDNSTNFKLKMKKLMNEIYVCLGVPLPLERKYKYLISAPNLKELSTYVNFTALDLIQTYLLSDKNTERRVRQYGQDGNFSYFFKQKDTNSGIGIERKISEKEYIRYITQMDFDISPIAKTRIFFAYKSQYFKIDIFKFSSDYALLELELTIENNIVDLPDFIKVIKDVSNDPKYRNYNLAKKQSF